MIYYDDMSRDKDFSTSEIGFSTFYEKGPKNAGFTTLKLLLTVKIIK